MSAALALELLRTHVNQGAALAVVHRELTHGIAQAARDTEISDFKIAALIYHQVRGLKITMYDPGMIVSIIERITKMADPIFQFVGLKDFVRLVRAQIGEGIAIHIFHRNTARSLVVHKVIDAH